MAFSKIFPSSSKTPVSGSPAGALSEVKRLDAFVEELSVERVVFSALVKRVDVAAQLAITKRLSTIAPIISFQEFGLLVTGVPPWGIAATLIDWVREVSVFEEWENSGWPSNKRAGLG